MKSKVKIPLNLKNIQIAKKKVFFIILTLTIVTFVIFLGRYLYLPKRISFADCVKIGGTVWLATAYHPDLCPSCSDYYQCRNKYGDVGFYCREKIGSESSREKYKKCVDETLAELDNDCPKISPPCAACVSSKVTKYCYLDDCPNGMKNIAEISDSSSCHQCCK